MHEEGGALAALCGSALERVWYALYGRSVPARRAVERAREVIRRGVTIPPDGWRSLVSDDHTPVELSVAFGGGGPELRFLFEAQGDAPTPVAQGRAARALDRWLEEEHGARLERLRQIEDLFLPEDHQGEFALWHGAIFMADGRTRFKIYLDPRARGREQSARVVQQALERLGNPGAFEAVAALADRGPDLDDIRFFSLDVTDPEQARIKVYVSKHRVTVEELLRASTLAHTHDTAGLRRFFECAAGAGEGLFAADRPLVPCFDFVGANPQPRHFTVHFPIRAYAAQDAEAHARIRRVFEAMGRPAETLDELVTAFATRELRAGSGLFAYVSHRAEASGPRVTVYLSTEARRVFPPHESLTPVLAPATNRAKRTKGGTMMVSEKEVREFYDDALHCYQQFMGDRWHHGDPGAEAAGASPLRACEILEEKIVAHLQLKEGDRVLDFGSGIGGPTLHMAKVTQATFIGVTNNDQLNQVARQRARERGLASRVQFVTLGDTDYKRFPFPDDTFDAVTFYESVCHVPDKAALFKDIARILKPGGRVAGMDWLQRPFGPYQTAEQVMELMRPVNELTAIPGHGTVDSYSQMMRDAGLEVRFASDLYEGVKSRGSATSEEQEQWLNYQGPEGERFSKGKRALDAAREAGVFTIGMFVAEKPVEARTEEPLVERIRRYEASPFTDHPFFQRLAGEPLSMERLWLVLRNFQEGVTRDFARRLAQITARVEEDDLRSVLAKQLDDELGNGDPNRTHRLLFDRFVEGMSSYQPAVIDHRTLEPGRGLGAFLEEIYTHRDPYEGVGATLLMEVGGRQVDQFLGDQFRRGSDLPRAVMEWLDLHETLEEDHVDEIFELAARVPRGLKAEATHRGVGRLAEAVWAFFDDLQRLAWPS